MIHVPLSKIRAALITYSSLQVSASPVASLGRAGGGSSGVTPLQGGDTRRKKIMGKFTKNDGQARSDR